MEVYKYTNKANGKVYIGITTRSVEIRHKEHLKDINDSYLFHRALRKYGIENFLLEVIDSADSLDELLEKEKLYIHLFNSFIYSENPNGYNMTTGGEGTFGYSHTEESKAAMSEQRKEYYKTHNHPALGATRTEESKEKQRIRMVGKYTGKHNPYFGKKHSGKTKAIMSVKWKERYDNGMHSRLGSKLGEETKHKISIKLKGRVISQEQRDNQSLVMSGSNHPNSLRAICTTTNEAFEYMGDASKKYGLDRSNLTKCCKGKTKWCGIHPSTGENLKWKYAEVLTFK